MTTVQFICTFLLEAGVFSAGGVMAWRWYRDGCKDRAVFGVKFGFTLLLAVGTWFLMKFLGIERYGNGAGYEVGLVPFVALFLAIVLSILWTPDLVTWALKPFTSALDGGDEEPEQKPFYSTARALSGRGQVVTAISVIEAQLKKFPGDQEGMMLLAEIQALSLQDLPAAEGTIQQLCVTKGKTPGQVAAALSALADWYLKVRQDVDSARRCFSQIRDALPNTEFAANAAQRIAHLGDGSLLPGAPRRKFVVTEGVHNLGLHGDPEGRIKPKETPPAEQTAQLVKQLEAHPLDTDAREQLAQLYFEYYQRVDMAALQLEELIAMPNQPARLQVRWLNRLADMHVAAGDDPAPARDCLQRIVDLFPGSAMADLAQRRLELLPQEFRGKTKSQAVKLGSYEQNIGLKYGPPPKR